MIEESGIRREIRPRRSADRLLVHHDQPLDTVQTFENLAAQRLHCSVQPIFLVSGIDTVAQRGPDRLHKELADQTRLAGSRYSSDAGKDSQRNVYVEVIEIVAGNPLSFSQAEGIRGVLPTFSPRANK
jgi:hypothetical protein